MALAKFDVKQVLARYFLFLALPLAALIQVYENFLSERSIVLWRHYFGMMTFSEHMMHASRTTEYFIPPRDTNQVIVCPSLKWVHHSEYPVDPETGMYGELNENFEDEEDQEGEGEDDWSDDHVWSVTEFIPRSLPCWSPIKPMEYPED